MLCAAERINGPCCIFGRLSQITRPQVSYVEESENFSFFTLVFSCNSSWKVSVRVKIARIIVYTNAPKVHDVVDFDMAIEPAAIDAFVSSLRVLAGADIGTAEAVLN